MVPIKTIPRRKKIMNKNHHKLFFGLLIIILAFYLSIDLSFGDVAGGAPEAPAQQNPWETPDYYNSLDWSTADFSKVDWNKVNWDQVDWNNIDSNELKMIAQNNPVIFENTLFFNKFESKLESFSETEFSDLGRDATNSWLDKKTNGKLSLNEGSNLKSYKSGQIYTAGTRSSNFNPEKLPPGVYFEILSDGSLKSKGKFEGSLAGKVEYDPVEKALITNGQFIDLGNNDYSCDSAENCKIEIAEDGTVKKIIGNGKINDIAARDLEDVSVINGKIIAKPNQKDSLIGDTKMFSEGSVSYDPKQKMFEGDNIEVRKTAPDTFFKGNQISFLDEDGKKVATLISGGTRFSTTSCSSAPCISANTAEKRITVMAEESKIELDAGNYKYVDVTEIKDNSQIVLKKGDLMVASFDQKGHHPRMAPEESGLEISYAHKLAGEKDAKQISGENGDRLCTEEGCTECNGLQQCRAPS